MKRVAIASMLGVGIAACVISSFGEGQFLCVQGDPEKGCPEGLICASDNRCRSRDIAPDATDDTGPPVDANGDDGGIECPDARFSVTLDGRRTFTVATTDDGRVFVGGSQNGQGWLAELHPCDGRILRERTVSGSTSFDALIVVGEELIAAGAATVPSGKGTGFGRFRRDLGTILFQPVDGYGGSADSVSVGSDSAIWVSGPRSSTTGFAARTDKCSVNLPALPGGIIAVGTNAVVLVRGTTVATLERVLSTCAREDGGVGTIKAGKDDVRPNALIALSSGYAAIGTANADAGSLAWIATSTATGSTWQATELDPNINDPDEGRAIAYDGDALFAGVSQRAISGGVGVPTLYRYASPVTKDAKPQWSAAPFGGGQQIDIRAVATTKGREGVFVVATGATSGSFARCTKSGQCR